VKETVNPMIVIPKVVFISTAESRILIFRS
jgi:hypothetical protein